MALANPNPKSNNILARLAPSVEAGKLLMTDIAKQALLREVRALPKEYQAFAIEGIILLLDGQHPRGIDIMERSLRLRSTDSVTWENYSTTLSHRSLFVKRREIINRSLDLHLIRMFSHALLFGAFWADLDMMKRVVDLMTKSQIPFTTNLDDSLNSLEILSELDEADSRDLGNAARIVMSIADREGLACKCSRYDGDGDGIYSFSVCIDTEDAHYLSKLNSEIIDYMVDGGMESSNCVAFFEVDAEGDE